MNDILWKGTERDVVEFFWKMTDEEAQAFFEEYVRSRDERLASLKRTFHETGGGKEDELNFTPDSLLTLWRWASERLSKREYTSRELEHIKTLPDWFREHQLTTKHLSEQTLALLNDIAFYFAEVFIRNHSGVQWMICKTKVERHNDANQPVLSGFTVSMSPRDLLAVAARKTLDGRAGQDELLRLYKTWTGNLAKQEF
jgi:hypothetical protein